MAQQWIGNDMNADFDPSEDVAQLVGFDRASTPWRR
jgi:hypothetical protein